MRRANELAREMWAPSMWYQRMSLAGQFRTFCRTHERTMNEESCAAFLMAIEVAPSTRMQYARMLRSMLEMNRTPLDMMILGLQNIAAQSETKQVRPLTKEEMNQYIRSRADWKERVVLRLAWITTSRWSEIAALTPKKFYNGGGRDPNFGLVRGAEDGEGGSPPRLAVRQDTRAGRLRHHKAMQDTSRKRKTHESCDRQSRTSSGSLECHGAFHKKGAPRHAAQIVETHNLNPHVISQLAKHVDPFDLPQHTVQYLKKYTTMLTQVSSLVALM
ncbi:hypothetical protein TcYC6_0101120 [Trypanosoma cruzi]|nr:hypothetical protein TcYC6_0101120 [Trypanosoma cruzi]